MTLLPALQRTIEKLITDYGQIPDERKSAILSLTNFISEKTALGKPVKLNFICTHNSRRSHIAQIWAQTAAYYYEIKNVETFSGGTEATAFNPKAVKAMKDAGFDITTWKEGLNPVYKVSFASDTAPLTVFSKKYDDASSPNKDFAAVMTCSHADENCPFITGSTARISLNYDDPKDFDNTPQEAAKYEERVYQIGREILFAFSQVSKKPQAYEFH